MHARVLIVAVWAAACSPAPARLNPTRPPIATLSVDGEILDQTPVVVPQTCQPPRYPRDMQQAGIVGRVDVAFIIDTTGTVEQNSLRVISSPHPGLNEVALQTVRSCRYTPGRIGSRAVRSEARVPITFSIEPSFPG